MIRWNEDLWLFTPEEFEQIPDGTRVEGILGVIRTKGVHDIPRDLVYGHLSSGIRNPFKHELKDLFLTFILKS